MNIIEEARKKLKNASEQTIINAFDIVGRKYLQNEYVYYNNSDELKEAFIDFNIYDMKEIIEFIVDNGNYKQSDKFFVFDGYFLTSFENLDYCKKCIYDKMDNEVAQLIIDEEQICIES